MKVLFDTSALIPALVVASSNHKAAFEWLDKVHRKEITGFVSAHSIAELYAFLSGPGKKRPEDVLFVIEKEIVPYMQVVALTEQEYISMVTEMAKAQLAGGITYDAIHAYAARKADVDIIVTGNTKDFTRLCPVPPPEIVTV